MVDNVTQMKANEAEEKRRMDLLDEVRSSPLTPALASIIQLNLFRQPQLQKRWTSIPLDDIQEWTLQAADSLETKHAVE